MTSISFRPWLALLVLLVYLTTGSAGAHAAAWCFGADGHAEFRLAPGGSCATEPVSAQGPEHGCGGRLLNDDHCGPCFDVPAALRARTQSPPTLDELLPQPAPPAVHRELQHPLRLVFHRTFPRPNAPPSLTANSPLRHLTTVVLLN